MCFGDLAFTNEMAAQIENGDGRGFCEVGSALNLWVLVALSREASFLPQWQRRRHG